MTDHLNDCKLSDQIIDHLNDRTLSDVYDFAEFWTFGNSPQISANPPQNVCVDFKHRSESPQVSASLRNTSAKHFSETQT